MINEISISLSDMVIAFTTAMDSVNQQLKHHHHRVTNIALNLAKDMQLSRRQMFDVMIAARLHDIGVMSISERRMLTALEFDADFSHALKGYIILKDFDMLKDTARIIKHHHDNWEFGQNRFDENGDEIPLASRIIHLADRIDLLINQDAFVLEQKNMVIDTITPLNNKVFHPDVFDAFKRLSARECFWLDRTYSDFSNKYKHILIDEDKSLCSQAVEDIGRAFSQIIDFRNTFTATHSAGVSATAQALTSLAGFDESKCKYMKIAGYLHDLGKITIPDSILQKVGPLNHSERLIISSHTYHTYNILSNVKGLEDINRWASFHHEKLNGTGYPFRKSAEDLDVCCRIMAVADIFTALTEDRPYRVGMPQHKVEKIMTEWVANGGIDKYVTDLMLSNYATLNDERRYAGNFARKHYDSVIVPTL